MIKECELVANTEVPKFDVHDWRKQRDVDMFGQVMLGLLPHVIAQVHTPYPIPTNMCYFSHFTAFSSHEVEAGLVRH